MNKFDTHMRFERKYSPDQARDEAGRFASSDAAMSYTGGGFHDIKQADRGKSVDATSVRHAKEMNAYMSRNAVNHAELYRGMNMTPKRFEKLKAGGEVSLDSMTSFTSSKESAWDFARGRTGVDSGARVVLIAKNVRAAPLTGRLFTGESEHIAPKGQKFKIVKIEQQGKTNYLHVEKY
jgi:hypothetical protein